jgi:predicted metalloprotease
MAERERETVVVTDGDRGSGGTLLAVVLLIAVLVVLFLLFGQDLLSGVGGGAQDVNVDVNLPGTGK